MLIRVLSDIHALYTICVKWYIALYARRVEWYTCALIKRIPTMPRSCLLTPVCTLWSGEPSGWLSESVGEKVAGWGWSPQLISGGQHGGTTHSHWFDPTSIICCVVFTGLNINNQFAKNLIFENTQHQQQHQHGGTTHSHWLLPHQSLCCVFLI